MRLRYKYNYRAVKSAGDECSVRHVVHWEESKQNMTHLQQVSQSHASWCPLTYVSPLSEPPGSLQKLQLVHSLSFIIICYLILSCNLLPVLKNAC